MKSRFSFVIGVIAMSAFVVLPAWAEAPSNTVRNVGRANPASQNCVDKGGTVSIEKNGAGCTRQPAAPAAAAAATAAAAAAAAAEIYAAFACEAGGSLHATFINGPQSRVVLVLSDGRRLSLPQALSADGGRYANGDESIVFWNKGNAAFIEENGKTTYSGCFTKP